MVMVMVNVSVVVIASAKVALSSDPPPDFWTALRAWRIINSETQKSDTNASS
jgi:hypothetical protein